MLIEAAGTSAVVGVELVVCVLMGMVLGGDAW